MTNVPQEFTDFSTDMATLKAIAERMATPPVTRGQAIDNIDAMLEIFERLVVTTKAMRAMQDADV
jgi:hypothetical protein